LHSVQARVIPTRTPVAMLDPQVFDPNTER
jgi:hypothetical protein